MKTALAISLLAISTLASAAQQAPAGQQASASPMAGMHHAHAAGAKVSYAELKSTVAILDRAKEATAKYQDVRVAQADGYKSIGPEVPGMGLHFTRTEKVAVQNQSKNAAEFDAEHPQILLYESNPSAPGGYSLVGVSYLLNSPEGADSQPLNPPFPKSLATWHRHENICVMPDRSTPTGMTEDECRKQDGHFIVETEWMVHAWIWKESPLGVFSPTNPEVSLRAGTK